MPSRSSDSVDDLECGTVACTCLEFHLLSTLLWFIGGIRTYIVMSVRNGFCPCVVVLSFTVRSAESVLAYRTLLATRLTLFQQGFPYKTYFFVLSS
jgi:hypothetical protein